MKSLIDFFEDSVQNYPDNPLIWEKEADEYKSYTYKTIQREVHELSNGLLALNINSTDRVALLSEGRRLWLVSELAILHIGAINVPLSTKLEADSDLIFRLNHSQSETIIVSKNQIEKIRLVKNQLEFVKTIIILDELDHYNDGELAIKDVLEMANKYSAAHPDALSLAIKNVKPETHANICYTSGTCVQKHDPKAEQPMFCIFEVHLCS